MNTIIETISPELAALYLRSNTKNRYVRQSHVKWLAESMKIGQWKLTHQGICFDSDGAMVDGQHRLLAIIESGQAVQMLVSRGSSSEGFDACDLGIVRSLADVTHLEKKKVEVLNLLSCIGRNTFLKGRHVPDHVLICESIFGAAVDRLMAYAGTSKKGTSKATVRAAAVLCMTEGNEYALQQYRHLSILEFSGMSNAVQSLARQIIGSGSKGGALRREQEFCRALHAFNPDNKDLSRLQVNDVEKHLKSAQERINQLFTA
jgi:hypothetical protein